MSDNSQSNSLSAIVDEWNFKKKFIDNPLDVYENYTYNLELLVVDRNADRRFQLMEAHNTNRIVTDSWPGPEDNSITIAKTGVTTEFHINDLEVISNSVGNSNNSKIAGTAISLQFNITQVGNTSLVDNLQNTIALCGYPSIPNAVFYIKINFLGYDDKGNSIKLPYTKVLPFTIKDYAELQTTTDARGTTTLITGVIITDEVISNVYLSKVENGFTYDVGDTLEDTLKNFLEKLNETLKATHPTLSHTLQNSYSIEASNQFKELKYFQSTMKGIATNTTESTTKKSKLKAQQIGTVAPLMSIYTIIEDICLNAVEVKKELVKSTKSNTNVLKITPFIVPKENGYNSVKGTNVYDIQYFIDFEKKPIIHNKVDQTDKAKASKQITEEFFKDNHVNKIYNYLFTGKNDQILDFNISLDRQLSKIYTAPQDSYAYEHFLNPDSTEGRKISVEHQQYISQHAEALKLLRRAETISKNRYEAQSEKFSKYKDDMRTQLVNQIGGQVGGPPSVMSDMVAGKSLEDLVLMGENGEYGDIWTEANSTKYKEYQDQIAVLQKKYGVDSKASIVQKGKMDTYLEDAFATQLHLSMENTIDTSNKIFNTLDSLKGQRLNQRTMILTENLNDDILSTLSNEDFETILKSQTNNPIIFERVISRLVDSHKIATLKATDPDSVTMAKEKYYESKSNNISMVNAQMTIKGDPFWIEGYMSPEVAKEQFGNSGTTTDKGLNVQTTMNGPNGCVIVSGIADGVDLNDNVLTRNLITSLYVVTTITSTFSGGRFLQSLTMRKNTEAEYMVSTPATIGPAFEGEIDVYVAPETPKIANAVVNSEENVPYLLSVINANGVTTASGPPSQLPSNPNVKGSLKDQHGSGLIVSQAVIDNMTPKTPAELLAAKIKLEEATRESRMAKAMSSYRPRNAIAVEPSPTPVGEEKVKLAEDFVETAELAETLHVAAETTAELPSGPLVRQAVAAHYLNALPGMTRSCRSEQARGVLPFVSCDAIAAHDKKILSIFETTPGVTPTIAEINAHLNNEIADTHPQNAGSITESSSTIDIGVITDADDGTGVYRRDRGLITKNSVDTKYSDYEIAQFQIAAGGVLSVDGHDPADIERIVRKSSLAKTPVAIIEEQESGVASEDVSSSLPGSLGAVVDNMILDGTTPIIVGSSSETLINIPPTPPMTEVEYEAKWETIRDDTTCVGQCRSRKIILLGKEYNDAVKEQYYIDKKVEALAKEAKIAASKTASRTLEIVSFTGPGFTQNEQSDRVVLSEAINSILDNNMLTSDEVAAKEALIHSTVSILDAEIKNDGLIISDIDRLDTVDAIIKKLSNEAALNALPEEDYKTVKKYEDGVKKIVTTAQTGHRADLTNAANIGMIQAEIAIASVKHDSLSAKTYYFDPQEELAMIVELEDLETDLTIKHLAQPDETIGQVATIETGGTTTFVPIDIPVEQVTVAQQPVVFKTTGLPTNTYDILLPGSMRDKLDAVGGDMSMLSQHAEAQKIYKLITNTDNAQMKVVTDDAGIKIKVKDFSKVGAITYTDANGDSQTIDPVALFSLHTTTKTDMYPMYHSDYDAIKNGISDLFPNISTTNNIYSKGNILTRDANGGLIIDINPNKFIVDPNP